ncbi:hypothetical protein K227x_07010 [Rubripirellula lacrimiformis]|uniref:Secreted protein n=1 Tax=Rubripirellula lacrimiformis TaxID=1930273 RepID=A0A517N5C2_9BACT|nr:hypothetical protein [Rubripirellula lacrimiformis]QDT02325.1 hypothetical protein K227x_07010 [Rubripirellula lacrimiformis]
MRQIFCILSLALLPLFFTAGCGGPNNEVTVSGVDDSKVFSEDQMKSMEEQYKADSGSR